MPRRCWVGGNFKSAATLAMVHAQIKVLNEGGAFPANVDVVIAPSALHIPAALAAARPEVTVAIQNIHTAKGLGAFTGQHTAEVAREFGLKCVLTGHSEMRSLFGETDEATAHKTRAALDIGASAIVCIGESLAEREAGTTMDVCIRQLTAVKAVLAEADWARVVVAYEPVWAIGTGKVASKEQAQEVHANLRAWFAATVSAEVAANIRIVYGGSVNAANCVSLISEADIDGFLVGGASLKPEFLDIIRSTAGKA